jgi:hypothetical protein
MPGEVDSLHPVFGIMAPKKNRSEGPSLLPQARAQPDGEGEASGFFGLIPLPRILLSSLFQHNPIRLSYFSVQLNYSNLLHWK